jgi:hypothetical protein
MNMFDEVVVDACFSLYTGQVVTSYRLYFLDGQGHIRNALEMECESDAEAMRAAQLQDVRVSRELWSLARFVARFERVREAS